MNSKNAKDIFSKNLNKLLESHNKTQIELANYIGVSNTTINNYVKGYNAPRMDKIDKIAEFFDVERSSLINNNNDNLSIDTSKNKQLTEDELKILDPYNQLNAEGKEKAVSYTWDLVDSNKYIYPTRQEMITYLSDVEVAAMKGYADIRTMTDDELKTLYTTFKEEDKWQS